ncbi:nuclear-interacting partner of ALK [Lingula anatina]|uniref:Nuclear-interacting partner of ALK n=1 Tax=Lingula anatina TaxID=7574 RepID=A0A1S3ICS6_LINAN|nr:nuclear-interacting partner of ALK [Lingula anatina]|eukprot:XP_013395661.2 nuclear-interacting partner of ALK [Lingula anatina]
MQAGFAQRVRTILSSFLHNETDDKKKELKNGHAVEEGDQSPAPSSSPCEAGVTARSGEVQLPTHARDRTAYFHRVETYSAVSWFAKPPSLCPLQCARYGWQNVDTDMLRCVSCKAVLCASLPKTYDHDVYDESCKKIAESLVSSHRKICPWPSNPSPVHFMSILYSGRDEALDDLLSRHQNLKQLGSQLPKLDIQADHELSGPSVQNLFKIVKQQGSSGGFNLDSALTDQVSCVLALCGWDISSLKKTDILICHFCRRQIGLWNFLSHSSLEQETDQSSQSVIENGSHSKKEGSASPSPKKRKFLNDSIAKTSFNPIGEHRSWCPWITSTQQDKSNSQKSDQREVVSSYVGDEDSRPGWKRLLDWLVPNSASTDKLTPKFVRNVKTTPPSEGLKNIRKVLHDWSSPTIGKL